MTDSPLLLLPTDRDLRNRLRERLAAWLRAMVVHDIYVARTVRGIQLEAGRLFDEQVVRPLLREVAARMASLRAPETADLVTEALPDVARLRAEVVRIVERGSDAVRQITEQRMADIARQEVTWTRESLPKATGFGAGVFEARLPAAVESAAERKARTGLWLGDGTEKWFGRMLSGPTGDKVRAWVTSAMQNRLTIDETVQRLVGTRAERGILAAGRDAAMALVRTAMTHASAAGRMESWKSLGIGYWRFRATLDLRTSVQCATEDGEVYRIGEGPVPPLHPNCRSVAEPVLDPNEDPLGKRAALGGQVPATDSFEDWIEQQTKAEQDAWFGKTKAAAWRAGRLQFRHLVGRDLEPLTIAELREMDRL